MPETKKARIRFFQEPRKVLSIASDPDHLHELIDQIALLKSAFEDELERTTSKTDKTVLEAAIKRSAVRLDTLKRIEKNLPVLSDNLKLLLQYGNNSDNPEIADYSNILDESPQIT